MGNVLSRNDTPAHNIAKAAAGWLAVFLASTAVLRGQRGFGLHEGVTPMQAASRVASFFHGTITTAAALPSCLGKSLEQIRLDTDAYNTDTENRILEFSIGYFLVDTVWLLKYDPDPTFLIHHFVTIVTWLSSRYLGNKRGQAAIGPMLGLAYAEMTAPLQNLWWLFKRAGNMKWANRISPPYTLAFFICRCLILPYYVIPISYDALSGRGCQAMQPVWSKVWAILFLGATVGGWVWAKNLIAGFVRVFLRNSGSAGVSQAIAAAASAAQ